MWEIYMRVTRGAEKVILYFIKNRGKWDTLQSSTSSHAATATRVGLKVASSFFSGASIAETVSHTAIGMVSSLAGSRAGLWTISVVKNVYQHYASSPTLQR